MHHTRISLWVLGLAIVAGCGTTARDGVDGKEGPKAKAAEKKVTEKKVELKTMSADHLFAYAKNQSGKVVVVDCWTTYCDPCMKEFPGLLRLQEKYGDKVVCISVSLNFSGADGTKPEDDKEAVMEFLTKQNATIMNVLSSTPDETFFQAVKNEFKLDEAPAGVPIILVLDQDGKLARRWDTTNLGGEGEFSYAKNVDPVVEKLVKP
jgi:thiol-disulfide isomerase/thioredoxin